MSTIARLLVLFATLAAGAPASRHPITHENVFLMTRTSRPVVSPDGRWILYNVAQPSYDPAQSSSDLWIVAPDGASPPRRLTATKEAESGAAWSPDSQRIAFGAKREGDAAEQIYVVAASGGEAKRMTAGATGASNPRWGPCGKAVLFEGRGRSGPPRRQGDRARVRDDADPRLEHVARRRETARVRAGDRRPARRGLARGHAPGRDARLRRRVHRRRRHAHLAGGVGARRKDDRLRRR